MVTQRITVNPCTPVSILAQASNGGNPTSNPLLALRKPLKQQRRKLDALAEIFARAKPLLHKGFARRRLDRSEGAECDCSFVRF